MDSCVEALSHLQLYFPACAVVFEKELLGCPSVNYKYCKIWQDNLLNLIPDLFLGYSQALPFQSHVGFPH